jgi:hypothetical protein
MIKISEDSRQPDRQPHWTPRVQKGTAVLLQAGTSDVSASVGYIMYVCMYYVYVCKCMYVRMSRYVCICVCVYICFGCRSADGIDTSDVLDGT